MQATQQKDVQTPPKAYTQPDKLQSSEGSAGAQAHTEVSSDMITVSEIAASRLECFQRERGRETETEQLRSNLNHTRT